MKQVTTQNIDSLTPSDLGAGFNIIAESVEAGAEIIEKLLPLLGKGKWRKGVEKTLSEQANSITRNADDIAKIKTHLGI